MAGGADKAASRQKRLASRLGVYFFLPIVAGLLGAEQAQVLCCFAVTFFAGLLEAIIALRLFPGLHACSKVPFIVRFLALVFLDLQCCWLAGTRSPGPDTEAIDTASLQRDPQAPEPIPATISTISVVLPCANETKFVKRTVQSIFEATPHEQLKEIIVIDDASNPSIAHLMGGEEVLEQWRVRIIRHDIAQGLIRSKKDGGDAAAGDAIIFLDCHVKPAEGWSGPILSNLRENPKRVVVPSITSLDPDSWTEISTGGATKMCMSWRADFFWCNGLPGHEVPIVSGGLVGMTSYWWRESGGYDDDMRAWGGENLDQSLRTWLCGGEIREAVGSRVAHMWRNPAKPETMLHYSIPTDEVRRNRLRATDAWLGPWSAKVRTFPEFEDFQEGGRLSVGSLDSFNMYQTKLRCKGFDWYIDKFKHLYLDTGLLPEAVFHIHEKEADLCLQLLMKNGKPDGLALMPCDRGNDLQRWHAALQDTSRSGKCCGGLKVWDYDACLIAPSNTNDHLGQGGCNLFGRGTSQKIALVDQHLRGGPRNMCMVPQLKEHQNTEEEAQRKPVHLSTCAKEKEGQVFDRLEEHEDGSFLLQERTLQQCLTIGDGSKLFLVQCEDPNHHLRWRHLDGGQLRNDGHSRCVDAADGEVPIIYPCYAPHQNPKQTYKWLEDGRIEHPRSWADNGRLQYPAKCLDARPVDPVLISAVPCEDRAAVHARWEKRWSEVPMETQFYRDVVKRRGFLGRSAA